MFYIIKKGTNNFWHRYQNNTKEVNISTWNILFDSVAQTVSLQTLNGSNIPANVVSILDVIVIDETDSSVEETFDNVDLLRTRLVALGYNPLVVSGGGGASNIEITVADLLALTSAQNIDPQATYIITDSSQNSLGYGDRLRVFGCGIDASNNWLSTVAFFEGFNDGAAASGGQWGYYDIITDTFTAISGGGGSATNLGYTASPTNGIVTSDTGTDATLPLADGTNAGLLKPSKFTLLEAITEAFTTALKTAYDSTVTWITTNGTNVLNHLASTSNPHSTTASQVGAVAVNSAITGATKTKITYDSKGLVTSGADATTADITDSTNKRYQTDSQNTNNDATSSIQTQLNGKQASLGFTAENVANKENSTLDTSTTKYPTNNLVKTYADAKVQNSLSASTTVAPSATAVNTALDSRIKLVSRSSAPTSALTGTTTETQMAQITLPIGSFSLTDLLKIRFQANKTTSTSTCTWRIKISTSATMPSGNTDRVAVFTDATGVRTQPIKRTFWQSSGNLTGTDFTVSLANDDVTIGAGLSTQAFNNTTTQYYLYISAQLTSSSDSVTLQNYEITN